MLRKKFNNCKKGYACGASCISMGYICHKSFPEGVSAPLTTVSGRVYKLNKANSDRYAEAGDYPNMNLGKKEELAQGRNSEVYLTDGPPSGVVKDGVLGPYEVANLDKAAQAGVAPKILDVQYEPGEDIEERTKRGKIATERIEGQEIGRYMKDATEEEKRKALDAVVEAKKKLHLAGVSHNDIHPENLIYNPQTGKVKLTGFRFSDGRPAAALMEAAGLSYEYKDLRDKQTATKLATNKLKLREEMIKDGIPDRVFEQMTNTRAGDQRIAIKNMMAGGWDATSKENEKLIYKYINIMYEGL